MSNSLFANTIMTLVSSFLSNSGNEIAKNVGKDIYQKLTLLFTKEAEKSTLQILESEPFDILNQESLEKVLLKKLSDKAFYQNISLVLDITTSNTVILELVLSSISDIKLQLKQLYRWWINAGADKKGEYQNRIEQLELQLMQLEEKFLIIIKESATNAAKSINVF